MSVVGSAADMRRGIYGDFAGYASVAGDSIEDALQNGLVVLDTNALLHLYSFHGQARQDYLDILTKLGSRLFIPHQVMEEFWRNRGQALVDNSRKFKEREEVGALLTQFQSKYDRWHRRVVSRSEVKSGTFTAVEQSMKQLLGEMGAHEEKMSVTSEHTPTFEDDVLKHLEKILEGKVGGIPNADELREMQIEGERRVKERIPPGYADGAKATNRSVGDYFVWAQALREAERLSVRDLVFITQDNKEDWWLYPGTHEARARPELVAEYKQRMEGNLYFLRTISLLSYGSAVGTEVSPDTLDQARNADDPLVQADWNMERMATYLTELGLYNPPRFRILRAAVEGSGAMRGRVTREQIAENMGVTADSGFQRISLPFKTVLNKLVEQDLLPDGLKVPFETGAGKFTECYVPAELIDLVSEALKQINNKGSENPESTRQEFEDSLGLLRLESSDGAWAEGYLLNGNGFRVMNGEFRTQRRNSASTAQVQLLQDLEQKGFFEDGENQSLRKLVKPYDFTSPSQASSCVLFMNSSGYERWQDASGTTLGVLFER